MAADKMLKGLFDRPIVAPVQQNAVQALLSGYQPSDPLLPIGGDGGVCGPGYYMSIEGFCVPTAIVDPGGSGPIIAVPIGGSSGAGGITGSSTDSIGATSVVVNNTLQITDAGINQVADAINQAIAANTKIINDQSTAVQNAITKEIQEDTDSITAGVNAASSNLGNEVTVVSAALAASTAATAGTVAKGINDELDAVKSSITPILSSISDFITKINAEVQQINDTFIQPLVSLYNSTVGTIATLTAAIEADLKDGITGLLQIPGQLAAQLGSFDASLQRTVEQLGTTNKETVTVGIDYLGQNFPAPFSAALSQSLTGKTIANSLTTTFADKVPLSSESLSQVSAQAISGLSTLLKELLSITAGTFKGSLDDMHANWASVESMFTGLLDGALSLLTTLTSIGVLASPLIAAAEQEAMSLVPTTKLDPATIIEALKRGFIDTATALTELKTKGLDDTRSQVLIDMSVYLADANQALDWWYRGIIQDADLIQNLQAHGLKTEDITAYKEGSIVLPTLNDLIRWMNFGLITQDQFTQNAKVLRYDDAQITAILSTYQDHETPQTLSQLSGLLDNSSAGFLNSTLSLPVPDTISTAGARAGYHPDLTRYIWLGHWALPPVETFIQAYFRGLRTKTELQQRMAIANIPSELWDDLLTTAQALIPYRSIPSFVKAGYMSLEQAQAELAAHGFDLAHQQLLMKAMTPPADTTNTTATSAIHTLSQSNAKTLWSEGAITDDQYTQVLEAHGYDATTAALQLKADSVTEHIKAQKQTLADLTAQVLAGALTLDDAVVQLNTAGFTQAQISKFQVNIAKQQKVNVKIPSIPELTKFLTAGLIDLPTYTSALQQLGWQDPWLTAYLGLVSANGVVATDSTGATA